MKAVWVFLGLGALGAVGYVVGRKLREASLPPLPPPGTLSAFTGPTALPASAPAAPLPVQTSFENPPRLLPDPFRVSPGQRYRWRYQKGALDLTGVPFSDVRTYDQPQQLPPDWPASMIAESPMTGYASGTWTGAPGELTKPFGMYQVWPTMATT